MRKWWVWVPAFLLSCPALLAARNSSDSVASIAGAILGARCPTTINPDWHAVVEAVNGHDVDRLAGALAALRR